MTQRPMLSLASRFRSFLSTFSTSSMMLTLLDLPKEIIIKIIGQDIIDGITLKSLRATCKAIEQIVAECDLQPTPLLRTLALDKKRILFGQQHFGSTGRDIAYQEAVICRRLFKNAHFDHIDINQRSFKMVERSNHDNVSEWMKQWNFITCNDLVVNVGAEDFDTRMFEMICSIKPRRRIYLDMITPRDIDDELFATIPPVPNFFVKWNFHGWTYESAPGESVAKVSDSLVIILAQKHRALGLECSVEGVRLSITPATILELVKIVLDAGHSFKAPLAWHTLKGALVLLGVGMVDRKLLSADPSVNVSSSIRNPYGRMHGNIDYTIKKDELVITISNFMHEPLAVGPVNIVQFNKFAKYRA